MDRRTFIKTGTLAAAATTLGGCRSCNTAPGPSPSAAGANTFAVEVHGGFAHILRRRGGKAESLLFGPTRAAHGHPHGMRLRIRKGEVNEPAKNVPYAEIMIEQTPWFVWDLLGWDIAVLPDGNVPSGEMKLPNNPALTDPRPDANWNSIAHIPDLSGRGAGALRSDYRTWMTSSVTLHAGTITVERPSERCAGFAMLKFGGVPHAVTDRLTYAVPFAGNVVLTVNGAGLKDVKQTLQPKGNAINAIVDFVAVPKAKYKDGDELMHYADLASLGSNTIAYPTYFQKNQCPDEVDDSPGIFCPPGLYTQDL